MEFLLSHWHCILPAAAIPIGLLLMGRSRSKDKSEAASRADGTQNAER